MADSVAATETEKGNPSPSLFVVKVKGFEDMFFYNEDFAKKSLFEVSINKVDDDDEAPFMKVYGKGKQNANLLFLYETTLDLSKMKSLSLDVMLSIVDLIGETKKAK